MHHLDNVKITQDYAGLTETSQFYDVLFIAVSPIYTSKRRVKLRINRFIINL